MEIKITNGYLLMDGQMVNLNSIRKITSFNDEQTAIIYNNGELDVFNFKNEEVQEAILNNAKYGEGFSGVRPC